MKLLYGNLWKVKADFRGITTNGFVKNSGAAVMGRGVALQARQKFPGLDFIVGEIIQTKGNHVALIDSLGLFIFPVKHNWYEKADLYLIERSAKELKEIAESLPSQIFVMPVPGIGNGRLELSTVWPILQLCNLPNNIIVVLYNKAIVL